MTIYDNMTIQYMTCNYSIIQILNSIINYNNITNYEQFNISKLH